VPSIFSQVDGDRVCPSPFGKIRSRHGIRLVSPSSLPNRGHMVNIDAEFYHILVVPLKLGS
jgi:hypothetical protein